MADYVNTPADLETHSLEKRGNRPSGRLCDGSKVVMVVGVSFGLLCIIQSVLNISLRLQGTGSNHINVTLMSAANFSALALHKDQLAEENQKLTSDNTMLKVERDQSQAQIKSLETEKETLKREISTNEESIQTLRRLLSTCERPSHVIIRRHRSTFPIRKRAGR